MAKWIQKYYTLIIFLAKNLFLCSRKQTQYKQVVTFAKVIMIFSLISIVWIAGNLISSARWFVKNYGTNYEPVLQPLPSSSSSKEVVPLMDHYKHQDSDSEVGLNFKVTIISLEFEFYTNVKIILEKLDQWMKRAKEYIGAVIVSFVGSYLVYLITRQ